MGHSTEYEHLGADIPDTKIVTPRRIVMSGDVEVRPFPPMPYDWMQMAAKTAHEPANPSRWQRAKDRLATIRMTW